MEPLHKKVKKGLEELAEKAKWILSCNSIDEKLYIELKSPNSDISEIYAQFQITKEGKIIDSYKMEDPKWIKYRNEHPMDTAGAHPSRQLKIIQYCRELMQN